MSTSDTVLTDSHKGGHCYLCLDFSGKVSSFPFSVWCWHWVFSILRWLCCGMFLLCLTCLGFLAWCGVGFLSNAFSAFIQMTTWVLFFILLMWYITFVKLCLLNHPCMPGMNPTWSEWMILICLLYCWVLLLIFCWGFLNSVSVMSLSGFGIKVILASEKEFGRIASLSVALNSLWRIGYVLEMFGSF